MKAFAVVEKGDIDFRLLEVRFAGPTDARDAFERLVADIIGLVRRDVQEIQANPGNRRLCFVMGRFNLLAYTWGMSMSVSEVEQAMLALDRREIAALVHRGIQALDHGDENESQEAVDTAWHDEVAQRINDIQSRKVEAVPLDESFDRARAAVAAMRK